jgi:hypothetical protein
MSVGILILVAATGMLSAGLPSGVAPVRVAGDGGRR